MKKKSNLITTDKLTVAIQWMITKLPSRLFSAGFILLGLMFTFTLSAFAEQSKTPVGIEVVILQIVDHPALTATRRGIEDELKMAAISYQYESAQGNPALASQIAQKFVGSDPKVLVGIGTAASQALAAEDRLQIPIVFSSVTDPLKAKLLTNLKHPEGIVTGVSNYIEISKSLDFLKKVLPNLSKLGIIYNPGEVNSVLLVEETKNKASHFGISVVTAVANNSAEVSTATRRLMNEVDAIFINNDNTALSAFESITKIAAQHNKPVFVSDIDLVKQGALGALGPNQYMLGRQTGKMILKILKGEKIQEIPVEFPDKTDTVINMETLKRLNLTLPSGLEQQITTVGT